MKVETLVFLPHSEIIEIYTLYFYKSGSSMKVEAVLFCHAAKFFEIYIFYVSIRMK